MAFPDPGSRVLPTWTWVAVGVAAWCGALVHRAGPWPVLLLGLAAAVALRRIVLVALAVLALASALGAAALAGLHPARPGSFRGTVTLVGDPQPTRWGTEVDVRMGGRRYLARAAGGAAGDLAAAASGEQVSLVGTRRGPPPHAPWLVPRRIIGVISATRAERVGSGALPYRLANRVRGVLSRGAGSMGPSDRALYLGFVLGDDRGQRAEVVDDFRGAGLSHLLVVSGQNLAFVLVLVRPLAMRAAPAPRLALTLVVLAGFGLLTRFEPSVLRALAMALVALGGAAVGRPLPAVQRLGAAVAVLVLLDPLLVWSVGFRLSVAASAGLALLAEPIAARVAGPRWWREGIAVTVAAQVGVAPLVIPLFGGLPVVSVPANLAAEPLAGLVTTWGLPAGFLAGLLGGGASTVLHLPTRLAIEWVAGVARVCARMPLGLLDRSHALVLICLVGVVPAARRLVPGPARRTGLRRGLAGVVALVLVHPAWVLAHPPAVAHPLPEVSVDRRNGTTVVDVARWPDDGELLRALRVAGVRRIDVLESTGPPPPDSRRALTHRWPVGRFLDRDRDGGRRFRVGRRTLTVPVAAALVAGSSPGRAR